MEFNYFSLPFCQAGNTDTSSNGYDSILPHPLKSSNATSVITSSLSFTEFDLLWEMQNTNFQS
jgi:hypothetical protein